MLMLNCSPAFRKRCGVCWAVLVVAVLVTASAVGQENGVWKPDIVLPGLHQPFAFVGYGDMRFTNPANTKDSNPTVRQAEIARIAEERPAFVLISGDLVRNGGNSQDWNIFDSETAPLRQGRVMVFPALGNHDVRGGEGEALENYFRRFPQINNRRWYSVQAGNVLVFVLDSVSADGGQQLHWLERGLDVLPRGTDFVLVCLHHPPITHSSESMHGGGHAQRPREQQLASMLEQRQRALRARIIVLAGHVHNYERYERGGVTYVVSGGGGATPYMVPRTSGDFYRDTGPTYHICNFSVHPGELKFQMLKLELEGRRPVWSVRDTFELRAQRAAQAASAR